MAEARIADGSVEMAAAAGTRWTHADWLIVCASVVGALALMAARAGYTAEMSDFYHFVVAGRLWGAGLDAYGPAFLPTGRDVLAADSYPFAYPPNWWLFAVGLGALKVETAVAIWNLLGIAAAASASVLLARTVLRLQGAISAWQLCLFVLFASTSDAMADTLRLGQPSLFILLGFALLLHGIADGRRSVQVAGLTLLMLKPQVGLLFVGLIAMRRETRGAAALSMGLTAVLCMPLLLAVGVGETVSSAANLFHNLRLYGQSPWNAPLHTGGLPHVLAYAGIGLPAASMLIAAVAAAAWMLRQPQDEERRGSVVRFWLVSVAALVGIVPLHGYDYVFAFTCLLLLPMIPDRQSRTFLLLAVVLIWIPSNLAKIAVPAPMTVDDLWVAYRLRYDLLTLGGLSLLGAALSDYYTDAVPKRRGVTHSDVEGSTWPGTT
jgi:hypothetical protein